MPTLVLPLVAAFLHDAAERRVPSLARPWFAGACAAAETARDPSVVAAAFAEAPRRLGRAALALGADEAVTRATLGIPWSWQTWRVDDIARVSWLVAVATHRPPSVLEALVDQVYVGGDGGARAAVLRALPLLPDGARFVALALDASRAVTRPVLEAIACDNPYPAGHLHEVHFTDLVLRAAGADLDLGRVLGVERRTTPELLRRAVRLAAERRASGRAVPAALARLTRDALSAA